VQRNELIKTLGASSLRQMGPLVRRVAGLSYLSEADFLPPVTDAEGTRLRDLATQAMGKGPAPIIVLGVMPRSGTNYVRDLLAKHPDVHPDPEQFYEFPLLHAAQDAAAFTERFIAMFPNNREVLGRWDALAMLSGAWLRRFQAEAGNKHMLLKCPHVQNLSLATHIFPGAKIVLCLRDGRDVTASSLKTFKRWSPARKTVSQLAKEWALGADAIMSFAPGGANAHPDVTVVQYESMVADTSVQLKDLLEVVGLDAADYPFETLDSMPVRGSSQSDKSDDNRWQAEAKAADFNPVGRWKGWSASRITRFHRIAGSALQAAGYDVA
jgi:protein-tyrosine sulfotransferase